MLKTPCQAAGFAKMPLQPVRAERYRIFAAGVCALILTCGIARFAYTPLWPVMQAQAGLSALSAGWLAAINYLGYLSGALVVMSVVDMQRKYLLYRIGLVVAVASTAAMGATQNVWVWGLWRYLAGFSSTAGMLLASALILDWLVCRSHRPELGLHFTGLGLGIAVSGLAAVGMHGRFSWAQQWWLLGALGLVFLVPAWRWLPAPRSRPGSARAAAGYASRPWMVLMAAAYFCAGFGYVVSATFIVAMLEKLPAMAGRGAWAWVLVGLAAAPSCFLWDRMAGVRGITAALLLAYGVQIVSLVIPMFAAGAALNLLSALLYGGSFVGIVSLTMVLVGRRFPLNPARAMGGLTVAYGVAQIVGPVVVGWLAAASGSYRAPLIVTSIIMILGMLLLAASGCIRRTHP
jgi:predicted MFS family arabinose efflux permease